MNSAGSHRQNLNEIDYLDYSVKYPKDEHEYELLRNWRHHFIYVKCCKSCYQRALL